MEHGGVGGVHLVLAVNAAGSENANGKGFGLHGVDLHGGGLRAQKNAAVLGEVEGIAPLAGGMPLLHIELGEVVFGKLDLAILENFKAHADEDVLDLVEHLIHRVLFADLRLRAGDGDVHGLGKQLLLHRLFLQQLAALFDGRFQYGADLIGKLTDDRPLLCAELAHLLENGSQLTLFAEIPDAQRIQLPGQFGA